MRATVMGLLATLALSLTGCGIEGKWSMHSIKPEAAAAHFHLQTVELMKDGTYTATVLEEGTTKTVNGTYTYDCETKTLTFKNGAEHSYHADMTCPGMKMKITGGEGDHQWKAVMKRD